MHTYAYGRGGAVRHTTEQRWPPPALECAGARQSLARRHRRHGRPGLRRAVRRARGREGEDLHGEARRVDALLRARLGRPGDVLDAGCGTGRVAIRLAAPRPPRGRRRPRRLDARRGPRRARRSSTGAWSTSTGALRLDRTRRRRRRGRQPVAAADPGHARRGRRAGSPRTCGPAGCSSPGFGLDDEHVPFTLPEGVGVPGPRRLRRGARRRRPRPRRAHRRLGGRGALPGGGYAVSVHTVGKEHPDGRRSART